MSEGHTHSYVLEMRWPLPCEKCLTEDKIGTIGMYVCSCRSTLCRVCGRDWCYKDEEQLDDRSGGGNKNCVLSGVVPV